MDTLLLDRALIFAVKAHEGQERRGKNLPYIVHPMEAVSIVATMTNDQEILAAAALHDVVEDTPCTLEDVRREFGDRVAKIVEAESEMSEGSWHERRQRAMDRLRRADRDAKTAALGDKLSNMRAMARDYAVLGDALWSRFHTADPRDHAWHYYGLADALSDLSDTDAYREFLTLIRTVFGEKQ